jgi:hypothetical protein
MANAGPALRIDNSKRVRANMFPPIPEKPIFHQSRNNALIQKVLDFRLNHPELIDQIKERYRK